MEGLALGHRCSQQSLLLLPLMSPLQVFTPLLFSCDLEQVLHLAAEGLLDQRGRDLGWFPAVPRWPT